MFLGSLAATFISAGDISTSGKNEEKKEVKYRQGRAIEAVHVNREGQKRPLKKK